MERTEEGDIFGGHTEHPLLPLHGDADLGALMSLDADLGALMSLDADLGALMSLDADLGALMSLDADLGALTSLDADLGALMSLDADPGALMSLDADPGALMSLERASLFVVELVLLEVSPSLLRPLIGLSVTMRVRGGSSYTSCICMVKSSSRRLTLFIRTLTVAARGSLIAATRDATSDVGIKLSRLSLDCSTDTTKDSFFFRGNDDTSTSPASDTA